MPVFCMPEDSVLPDDPSPATKNNFRGIVMFCNTAILNEIYIKSTPRVNARVRYANVHGHIHWDLQNINFQLINFSKHNISAYKLFQNLNFQSTYFQNKLYKAYTFKNINFQLTNFSKHNFRCTNFQLIQFQLIHF